MSSANPAVKHHYTPQFLLAQWTGEDGKLWRFTKPYVDKIAVKAVAPAEIGYEKHLYTAPGLSSEAIQQIEEKFMSPLDAEAAQTHQLLLAGKINGMSQKRRSAWSRFIMSQWFRTPEGVAACKTVMSSLLSKQDPGLQAKYEALKKEGYPPTLELAAASLNPNFAEHAALEIMCKFMDDPKNGLRLNNMAWVVRDIDGAHDLLVSDVLLQQTSAVFGPAGYITMPIAPRKLFFAAHSQAFVDAMFAMPRKELVSRANRAIVRRASQYVGATDLSQSKFIDANFGHDENALLIKGLAKKYAEEGDGG